MTVIKFHHVTDMDSIRPLKSPASEPEAHPLAAEVACLRASEAALRRDLTRLEAEVEAGRRAANEAFEKGRNTGFEQGRKDGLDSAVADRREHLALLTKTASEAAAAFERSLGSLESLAPLLALTALEKVLGERTSHKDLIEALVLDRLQALANRGVIRVDVAQADFDSPEDVEQLQRAISQEGNVELRVCPTLPRGACRLRLQLGCVDVGLDQRLTSARALLEKMAEATP